MSDPSETGHPPPIDQQLCFALYRATHAVTRAYRGPLQDLGLTYTQYLVLLALWECCPRSMGELAQALDLDMGACTPVIKRMEGMLLVERQRDQADERRVLVTLGERADALRVPCGAVQRRIVEDSGLDHAGLNALRRTLHGLADSLTPTAPAVK